MRLSLLRFATGLLLAPGFLLTLSAQPVSPPPNLAIRFSHSAEGEITVGDLPVADLSVNATRVLWQNFAAWNEATRLAYAASWQRFAFDRPASLAVPDTLDEIALELGVNHRLNDRWRLSAKLAPGLYGDLEGDKGDAFNAPLLALATWRQNESLAWAFGLRADGFSDRPVLPVIGVDWQFAPAWKFTLGMPRAGFTYRGGDSWDLGLGVSIQGGNYRIGADPRAPALSGAPSLADTYLDYHEIRVGLALDYRFSPTLALTAEIGAITDQKFDYFDRHYSLNGGEIAYFSLGLAGRF